MHRIEKATWHEVPPDHVGYRAKGASAQHHQLLPAILVVVRCEQDKV